MLFTPITQIQALDAQRRMFAGVRYDGPVEVAVPAAPLRSWIAARLASASQAIAPAGTPARRVTA